MGNLAGGPIARGKGWPMAERVDWEREDLRRVETTEDVAGTEDVVTTDEVAGTEDVSTEPPAGAGRRARRPRARGGEPNRQAGLPPEDEDVNPVGSYESWDQSGQSLDAAGSGMTGDSGSVGLTGTGFEDDNDLG